MRRAMGPIMTTGVALVVAGVVVANPIVAPRSDVQIAAVQLAAGTDSSGTGMLDAAFLDAIGPNPPGSTSPLSVLKELIASLAADVTYFSRTAIVDAVVAGVAAVSQPELTAAAFPYVGPPAGIRDLSGLEPAGLLTSPIPPDVVPDAPVSPVSLVSGVDPSAIAASPASVAEIVAAVVADAYFVSSQLVAAVVETGNLVVSEPALIAATLRALVAGDIQTAFESAVKAVAAPLRPPGMVLEALRAVAQGHVVQLITPDPAPSVATRADVESIPVESEPAGYGRKVSGASAGVIPGKVSLPSPAAAVNIVGQSTTNPVGGQRKLTEPPHLALQSKPVRAARPGEGGGNSSDRPIRANRIGPGSQTRPR